MTEETAEHSEEESLVTSGLADVSAIDLWRAAWRQCNKIAIDALYTARGHQVAAHRWAAAVTWLGVPAGVLTALTAGGAGVSAIVGQNSALTATLALTATALSAVRAFLRPEATLQAYENKGAAYLALRTDAEFFRDVVLKAGRPSIERVESQVQSLVSRRNALNSQPPMRVPNWAYETAKRRLEAGEVDYESDKLWVPPPF